MPQLMEYMFDFLIFSVASLFVAFTVWALCCAYREFF